MSRWRVLVRTPSRVIALIIIAIFVLMAIVGPYLYPKNLPINPHLIFAGPSWQHPLGTDFEGTDILAEIVTGARYVIEAALLAAVFTVVIGTAAGLAAGYYGRFTDSALMRIADFILTIPGFPLLLVLSTVWSFGSPVSMGLVLGVTGWGALARAVRSQTLSIRQRGYLEAARGLGLSGRHIIIKEILPNIAPYIGMNLLFAITGSILAEQGLFFLGVLPFSTNNWGVMLNQAVFQNTGLSTPSALSYVLSPLACLLLITLAIVMLLGAVDEIFNPRLRRVK